MIQDQPDGIPQPSRRGQGKALPLFGAASLSVGAGTLPVHSRPPPVLHPN
jgi:hypothetical protein